MKDSELGGTCGKGYYPSSDDPVAMIDTRCTGLEYGTAHELGHNMGAKHNAEEVS